MRKYNGLVLIATGLVILGSGCSFQGRDTAATGSIVVQSDTSDKVFVDGNEKGLTNKVISGITMGGHEVVVIGKDRTKSTIHVTVVDNNTTEVTRDSIQNQVDSDNLELEDNSALDGLDLSSELQDDGAARALFQYSVVPDPSVTADFTERDSLPESTVSRSRWASYGTFGPPAAHYPKPKIPTGKDPIKWKQERIVAVAEKYLGLQYRHKHIPALGLDCSNFTAWVYNYGLGIQFTSSVSTQGATVGRRVSKGSLQTGDLLYFNTGGRIGHTGIYLGSGMMIDESTMNGSKVAIKSFTKGWPNSHFAYAKRVIE